jgi:hypothetical protein
MMNDQALTQKLTDPQTDDQGQVLLTITSEFDDLSSLSYHTNLAKDILTTEQRLFRPRKLHRGMAERVTGVQGFEKYLKLLRWLERMSYSEVIVQQPHLNALLQVSQVVLSNYDLAHWHQLQGQQAIYFVSDLNVCIANYRHAANQPEFKRQLNNRLRNQRQRVREMQEWINHHFKRHSKLLLIRLDTGFNDSIKPHLTSQGLTRYRQQLIDHVQRVYPAYVGFLWKLEWRPLKSYHFHWLLVFNGQQVKKDVRIAKQIGEHWKSVILQGDGIYHNCNADSATYERNAIGMVDRRDSSKRAHFSLIINYLTKLDDYLRHQLTDGSRGFGKSERKVRKRPKIAKKDIKKS